MTGNLVLVRAGDNSEHVSWLRTMGDRPRDWDLAVSYYGRSFQEGRDDLAYFHEYQGGKWSGLFEFFKDNPEAFDRYDYIWLPDDDIEVAGHTISRLFETARQYRLELCQPALSLDSVYSHRITLENPEFILRYTNFVELMVPLFNSELLSQTVPFFRDSHAGLGLDWIWHTYARDAAASVAIIDNVSVAHRRPLNVHLRGNMAKLGVDWRSERNQTMHLHGIKRVLPFAHAGILRTARRATSRLAMACVSTRGYFNARRRIQYKPWKRRDFLVLFWRHLLREYSRH